MQPVAEALEVVDRQLLHLVRGVAALEVRAQRPALDRLGQDHRRLALVVQGRLVRRVDLPVVVAAAPQVLDLLVGHVLDHLAQPVVVAEEVLADVGARLGGVGLELAVRGGIHPVDQHAVPVLGEQRVPGAVPDQLDHVPAGAPEDRLQLLDDLPVAAHRAVQALKVAVDHEGQVVQALPRGDRQLAQRLRLVHLPVAEEGPHVRPGGVRDPARVHVAVHPRLEDRADRAETHGDRRELPEVRHRPRVRVRGQHVRRLGLLLPEAVQVPLAQPVEQVRARVDAGGGVPLEEDLVAAVALVLAPEEVVEAHVVQRGGGGEGRDVTADTDTGPLRARDHHRGVPAGGVEDLALDLLVAGEERLALGRDGVDVVRAAHLGHGHALLAGALDQPQHQVPGPLPAALVDGGVQGVEPLPGFLGIEVRNLTRKAANDDRTAITAIGCGSHAVPSLSEGRCSGCPSRVSAPIPPPVPHRLPRGGNRHLYRGVTGPPVRIGGTFIRVSYPHMVPNYANGADRCGVCHLRAGRRDGSCGDTAGIVTVSAVPDAGYLRDPSRPCGLRPGFAHARGPRTSTEHDQEATRERDRGPRGGADEPCRQAGFPARAGGPGDRLRRRRRPGAPRGH